MRSTSAAGRPPACAFAPKSKERSCTCRLPALAPEACTLGSCRSRTTTVSPPCASSRATAEPTTPAPITATSASILPKGSLLSATRGEPAGGSDWRWPPHSGFSAASAPSGTGRAGGRGAKKAATSGGGPPSASTSFVSVPAQKRPWQRPMPARVRRFTVASVGVARGRPCAPRPPSPPRSGR